MAYVKTDWENLPSTDTPITETALDNMENGIEYNDQRLNGTKPMGSIVVDDVNCKNLLSDYTIVNGWISGTSMRVNSTNGNRMAFIPCQPNTTYTVSRSVLTGTFRVGEYTLVPAMTSSNVDYTIPTCITDNNASSITYTTTANAKYLIVHYGLLEDSNLQASFDTIQVEVGSTATSYTKGKHIIKEENGYVKESTTFYADDFKCKNIYNPSYRANDGTIAGTGGNRTENNGAFSISAVTSDAYFWGVIAQNNSYQDTAGELYEFEKDSYTISLSNSAFNNQYITYYNENKVSLGYTRFGNSTFTINKSDKTGAKYFTIRFGKINATSGTTYTTTVQLEVGSEATPYTPYKAFEKEEIYSTAETKIGTWIDGKTLYRKTFQVSTGSYTNGTSFNLVTHNLSNIGVAWINMSSSFVVYTAGGQFINFNYYLSSTDYARIWLSSQYVRCNIYGDALKNQTAYITIEYTKTTD